jgi:hypothetical protein
LPRDRYCKTTVTPRNINTIAKCHDEYRCGLSLETTFCSVYMLD